MLAALAAVLLVCSFAPLCAQKKTPPAKPIDLNTATAEQLQQLPGVGPVTAKSIVDFRKKSGPFRRTADLLAVRGISEGRFKQIQPYVMVAPAKAAGNGKPPVAPSKTTTLPKPPPASPPKPATPAK